MRIHLIFIAFLIVIGCTTKKSDAQEEIIFKREEFNKAFEQRDTTSMKKLWTEDVHAITSRSYEVSGKNDYAKWFSGQWDARNDLVSVRNPSHVEVFEKWNMASERGTWDGSWTESGVKILGGGEYFAKWHRVDGQWLMRAEIVTYLRCSGSEHCDKSPS